MTDKLQYDTPCIEIVIFPEQDIITSSNIDAELPMDYF